MEDTLIFCLLIFFLLIGSSSSDGPLYDSTAYTECKAQPEQPLYGGGIIINDEPSSGVGLGGNMPNSATANSTGVYSPAFTLHNLTKGSIYSLSSWVLINILVIC